MKKNWKNFKTLLISMGLMVSLSACAGTSNEQNTSGDDNTSQETFLTREEVEKKLKNYSFAYSYTFTENGVTEIVSYSDKRSEDAWLFSTDGESPIIFLANKKTMALYMLYPDDKIGALFNLEDDFEAFGGWGIHLFSWYEHAEDFTKKGTAIIAGKTCTVYEYGLGSLKYAYYIDREYDLCLKFEVSDAKSSMKSTFEFTKFQIGGVTTQEIMAVLEGYKIDDYRL